MSYDPFKDEATFLQMMQLQRANIAQYATEVGASAADITEITNDADNMEWIIEFCELMDEAKKTAFKVKEAFIRGTKDDDPVGAFVTPPANTPPFPLVADLEKRARERNGRFLKAKGITEAAKVALGLVGEPPKTDSVQPTIKVAALPGGYAFEVTVRDKQDATMFTVQVRRMNSETWKDEKSGTSSPIKVTITPSNLQAQAERIEVRVQLYKKDEPYGNPSDAQYVTVNP